MKFMIKPKYLLFLTLAITCLGIAAWFSLKNTLLTTEYECIASGESYRYVDGVRKEQEIPKRIEFTLTLFDYGDRFLISSNELFPEMQNSKITLDVKKSNSVDAIYNYDVVNNETKFRTVSSLIFNRVSGDYKIFHHRWIPPNDWKDSDLYTFQGYCLPAKKIQEIKDSVKGK
jgi:hypothetical protein